MAHETRRAQKNSRRWKKKLHAHLERRIIKTLKPYVGIEITPETEKEVRIAGYNATVAFMQERLPRAMARRQLIVDAAFRAREMQKAGQLEIINGAAQEVKP